jgi:hypothetical protein
MSKEEFTTRLLENSVRSTDFLTWLAEEKEQQGRILTDGEMDLVLDVIEAVLT